MSVVVPERSGVLSDFTCWYPQFLFHFLVHARPFRLPNPLTFTPVKTSCNGAPTSQASDLTSRESSAPELTTGEET